MHRCLQRHDMAITPYAFISKQRTIEPERFTLEPIHQMPGRSSQNQHRLRRHEFERCPDNPMVACPGHLVVIMVEVVLLITSLSRARIRLRRLS